MLHKLAFLRGQKIFISFCLRVRVHVWAHVRVHVCVYVCVRGGPICNIIVYFSGLLT